MPMPFINRELTWLEFNQRVLDEARNENNPLLERIKFLAITASNLDEFFMVRVGGLQMLKARGSRRKDPAGLTPQAQLEGVEKRVHRMVDDQQATYLVDLESELASHGLRRLRMENLSERQHWFAEQYFENEVFPILSPMAMESGRDVSLIRGRVLHLAVRLRPEGGRAEAQRLALIPLGSGVTRMISLPAVDGHDFLLIEDMVSHFAQRFFEGFQVLEAVPFRITRNADMSLREDLAMDLLAGMEGVLDERITSDCVRLDLGKTATRVLEKQLQKLLQVDPRFVYRCAAPIHLGDWMELAFISGFDDMKARPWPPVASAQIDPGKSLFENIRERDILLNHPYEQFDPVLRLMQEAAEDPDVVAIKQILYRTSKKSPVVQALIRAAERGKNVTVLVELKARFDEQRNMEWAREMELAGVQVIYGLKGLKTHAKICLIVRREAEGLKRYMHFGTGNYNEVTAQIYSDISYLTCHPDLARDASTFFNTITGFSQPQTYQRLEAAPLTLRDRVLAMIHREAEAARQGQAARIVAKVNSLADPGVIEALYEASAAGVKIQLNVRGICCLVPGLAGLSENIEVISIVDRFLEHARIFFFQNGGKESVWISSADWMPRNLIRRVELLVPILDNSARKRLLTILEAYFEDDHNAWVLQSDGHYLRRTPTRTRRKPQRSQQRLYQEACAGLEKAKRRRPVMFEPLTSAG